MNNITLPACLPNYYSYDILEQLKVEILVERNVYQIPIDALFLMAARKNTKRGFLFVSKILGKHIPVHPFIPFVGGAALAARYASLIHNEKGFEEKCDFAQAFVHQETLEKTWSYTRENLLSLPEKTLFIGFAETATALGHSVFSSFSENASYIHTTRENILGIDNVLNFAEEHSHAMEHYCYAIDPTLFENEDMIVLVDDEITTGKSALNFIRAIQSRYPRKRYGVVSLLDWRSESERQRFVDIEKELGICIYTVSLVSGCITVTGKPVLAYQEESRDRHSSLETMETVVETLVLDHKLGSLLNFSSLTMDGKRNPLPYLYSTGRFGMSSKEQIDIENKFSEVGTLLKQKRQGEKTLCLGTGEFMYLPFKIASYMGEGVSAQSTTRSPIHPAKHAGYAVQEAISFAAPNDPGITNYVYNIPTGYYDEVFIFFERTVNAQELQPLLEAFAPLQIPKIYCVICVNTPIIPAPQPIGSYSPQDVVFLLKNIDGLVPEIDNQKREEAIQGGTHYSEMLPVEYQPTADYLALFHEILQNTGQKIALATAVVAEQILKRRGQSVVLVSLARAGTPIGILIKRYLAQKYKIELPHYSISIIRGKGIDENAILYIKQQHPDCAIQFIDGWTGKGAITTELIEACQVFNKRYGVEIEPDLAVLADPGSCVSLYGTREDFCIPSACLNSTVSGLISRTVHRNDLIGQFEFHGTKFYKEWLEEDVSQLFIDTIVGHFPVIAQEAMRVVEERLVEQTAPTWAGLQSIKKLQTLFEIPTINMIKPGVGETTRVLLRRIPWKILVDCRSNPNLQHILLLAHERGVEVEEFPDMAYSCCGLIKTIGSDL
ncbi:phosphoribosyltransferase [Pelosinus sp. sgz500959]|uniref:phosphoribosyltransferase n=1 Tax=Pelosinus sp. sgz500959 TaxID=3242472 RepID=UPI00366DEC63